MRDRELVALTGMLLAAGATQTSALGVIRVHADGLRRIAKAQAELYESEIEQPLRRSGSSEQQLLDYGAEFGDRAIDYIERVVLGIFRRHREHVWIEHRIAHAVGHWRCACLAVLKSLPTMTGGGSTPARR